MSEHLTKIVMASGNAGKIRELARLLADLNIEVVAQSQFDIPEAIEDGNTFAANSLIKAKHAARLTGLPAIADDSGLCVDALDGAPGVHSARFAGSDASDDDNIDKLLDAMRDVADDQRSASFHCVASFAMPDSPQTFVAKGEWHGSILRERLGDGGFGYDPVFFDPDSGGSSAQLSAADKNARSHRGQALRKLVELLKKYQA